MTEGRRDGVSQREASSASCTSDCGSEEDEGSDSEGSLDEDAMLARMLQAHTRVARAKTGRARSVQRQDADGEDGSSAAADAESRLAGVAASQQESQPSHSAPEPVGSARDDGAEAGVTGQEHAPALEGSTNGADFAQRKHAPPDSQDSPPVQSTAGSTGEQQREKELPSKARGQKKPKGRKERRKAQEAAAEQQGLLCTVCNAQFETRNQLFKHITAKGHAQLK